MTSPSHETEGAMDLNERVKLAKFVEESNRIEGIHRVTDYELDAHAALLVTNTLSVNDLETFVRDVAAVPLRDREGMDVRVGSYRPPKGGPGMPWDLRDGIETFLQRIKDTEPTS